MTAVAPVVARCSGLWVGWPGIFLSEGEEEPEIPESDSGRVTPTAGLLSKQVSVIQSWNLISTKNCVP